MRNVVDNLVITCKDDKINTTINTTAAQDHSLQQTILLSLFLLIIINISCIKNLSQHVKMNNIATNKLTQREYCEKKREKYNMLKIVIIQKRKMKKHNRKNIKK